MLVELPFPASREVVDQLLFAYLDKFRRPTHAIFVLDLSGSMEGERLASLKQALVKLTGTDTSVSGRFAGFRVRERITIITFSTQVLDERDFTVDRPASLEPVRDYVNGLETDASTAIFSALQRAYERVDNDAAADAGYLTSVVLMTDGENNAGISVDDFLTGIRGGSEHVRSVKTFAIRFGEADPAQLQPVASATGGAVFDAVGGSLAAAFKEIRGHQ